MKVYWLSRHELSPAQRVAIRDLHGEEAEIVRDPVVFESPEGLLDYIRSHTDGFVYAVAGAPHYISAALEGVNFGIFENHPGRREDGAFGLAAVYHVVETDDEMLLEANWIAGNTLIPLRAPNVLRKVWVNPDPESDEGEALVPIARQN